MNKLYKNLSFLVVAAFFGFSLFLPAADADEIISVNAFPGLRFSTESVISLNPGEISGSVLEPDGITPHVDLKIAIVDSEEGDELHAVFTDENGRFAIEGVEKGRYVLVAGNPGLHAVLDIEGEPEVDNDEIALTLPRTAASSIMPGWAPGWAQSYPGLGVLAVAGGGSAVAVLAYRYNTRTTAKDGVISPIMP